MSAEDDESEEGGGSSLPSLGDVARLLRKRKLIVLFTTILMGTGSLGLLQLITPQYMATATVLIDPRDRNVANMKQVTSDLVVNSPTIESETEIIHSTAVAGRVIDDMGLSEDPELLKSPGLGIGTAIRKLIKRLSGGDKPVHAGSMAELIEATDTDDVALPADNPVESFVGRVSAERVRDSFVIQIGYKSRDPGKAARVTNAIAETYVKMQVEGKMAAARQATVWLDGQLGDLRTGVFAAEKAVAAYRSEQNLFNSEGQPLDEREVGRQLEQLTLSRNTTAETRAKYQQARQILDSNADISTIGEVLKSNSITALKAQYSEALRQQSAAAARYGSLHPALIKAQAQLDSTRSELRQEVERVVTNLKSEAEQAAAAQAELEANLARTKEELSGKNNKNVRLHELEREATASREVYENFLKRVQETKQQQELQSPDARVVNRATVPAAPVSPKKMLIIGAGFGGGVALGLVLAIVTEFLFPSFVRTNDIEKSFKLRHITTIARFAKESGAPGPSLTELRTILVAPHSALAQAIRTVRVAIGRQRQGRQQQIVLVTSAVAEEGKSVVASNLALHFSLSGVRTLLIDCDLSGRGLSPLMLPAGGMSMYDSLMSRLPLRYAIVREAATGLHFLPGITKTKGSITPTELLASPLMAAALKKLAQEFEIIVLDGPGLLASVDSRILAELSDQIVFVHKWGATPQAAARQALRALGRSHSKVTGVVLNQVESDQLSSEEPLAAEALVVKGAARREPSFAT
jgi:polysaccharide biosynthesis transport protein